MYCDGAWPAQKPDGNLAEVLRHTRDTAAHSNGTLNHPKTLVIQLRTSQGPCPISSKVLGSPSTSRTSSPRSWMETAKMAPRPIHHRRPPSTRGPQSKSYSPASQSSYPPSSSTNSPAKSKPRLDGNVLGPETSPASDSGDDTRELPELTEMFPTLNKPVLDTVLKDMLLSLRSTIQSDMATCMHRFNREVQEVGNRVNHIESKMEVCRHN